MPPACDVPESALASLHLTGLAADGLGIALWQADGAGPEPAAAGHAFNTPIGRIHSHYYIASRDYAGIDPRARGALAAHAPLHGFARLTEALREGGIAPSEIVIRLPLITPGEDREGIEWNYRDGVETRYLRPAGPIPVLVRGETALKLDVQRLVLTEDYRGAADFAQARLSLATPPFAVAAVPTRNELAGAIARAVLQDLNGRPLRFTAERVVLLPGGFTGHGRTHGYFAEIPTARLATPTDDGLSA